MHCNDPVFLLNETFSVIDQRFLPLDAICMQTNLALYGAAAVRYILRTIFGDAIADAMNGGTGNDLRWFLDGHYALISGLNNTGGIQLDLASLSLQPPPSTQGFMFPPPFGRPPIVWINEIKDKDRAVFYYGVPPGQTTPCFNYGRIDMIEAEQQSANGVLEVDDSNYSGDSSLNTLIRSAGTHTLPGRAYNVVRIVFGAGVEASRQGILPPAFVVESRLPDDDLYNSPTTSGGERVLWLEFEWILTRADAQSMADYIMAEFRNVKHHTVPVTVRGIASMGFGRVITPRMNGRNSDASLGIDGNNFRVMKFTHNVDFERKSPARDFETVLHVRPTSWRGT